MISIRIIRRSYNFTLPGTLPVDLMIETRNRELSIKLVWVDPWLYRLTQTKKWRLSFIANRRDVRTNYEPKDWLQDSNDHYNDQPSARTTVESEEWYCNLQQEPHWLHPLWFHWATYLSRFLISWSTSAFQQIDQESNQRIKNFNYVPILTT